MSAGIDYSELIAYSELIDTDRARNGSRVRVRTVPGMRRFVPLVFGLFGGASEALQMAAADVLTEIVAKRMEPVAKLALVQQLNVAPVCARWRDALPGTGLPSQRRQ